MRKFYCYGLGIFLFFAIGATIYAQETYPPAISASFSNKTPKEIFSSVENQYPYRFFYAVEPEGINAQSYTFTDVSISTVVDTVLEGTDYAAIIYQNYTIVIGNRAEIEQVYSSHYFTTLAKGTSSQPVSPQSAAIQIGTLEEMQPDGRAQFVGRVKDAETGNILENAKVSLVGSTLEIATDPQGLFRLNLPSGTYNLLIERLGYDPKRIEVYLLSGGTIELELTAKSYELETVVVEAEGPAVTLNSAQIGVTRLSVERLKKLPSFMGEVDVVKGLLLQPGVSNVGEASNGFNVRGGNADQNLLLQDGGMLFNSTHALGFFSTFNTDLVQSVNLYKGNIPAEFGGRLASVLDVKLKSGSYEKWLLNGGIGPISGRINLEGPLKKDQTSISIATRSSYSDWVLSRINNPDVQNSSAFFLDGNLKLSHRLSEKGQLTLSGYYAEDDFEFAREFGFRYDTRAIQGEYVARFSGGWRSELHLSASEYNSEQRDLEGDDAANWQTGIRYIKAKERISKVFSPKLEWVWGGEVTRFEVLPGEIGPGSPTSLVIPDQLQPESAWELAGFSQVEWALLPQFSLLGGIRLMYFNNTTSGSEHSFLIPEPRISANFKVNEQMAVKGGYSRTSQFVNQISQLDSPTPTAVWQLANDQVDPFRSHNSSIGVFMTRMDQVWEYTFEVYHRGIDVLYDYQDFAQLVMNPTLSDDLAKGKGRAYGAEFSIKKNRGNLTGWLSYTLSRTERQVNLINRGDWYKSNFDKTHDLSLVSTYQFNRRHGVSVNFIFGTGRPTTVPVGSFQGTRGIFIPDYSLRNRQRIPDYHRLDISYTIGRGYKRNRKFDTSWTVSLYNVYSRRNAYSVFFVQRPFQETQAFRLAILGGVFPAITYNLTMR